MSISKNFSNGKNCSSLSICVLDQTKNLISKLLFIYPDHHSASEFQVILSLQFFILIKTVTSWKCSTHLRLILPSHGNQSNGFQGRSVTWFLYYWNIDLERINIDGKHVINSLANFQMWWLVKRLLKKWSFCKMSF